MTRPASTGSFTCSASAVALLAAGLALAAGPAPARACGYLVPVEDRTFDPTVLGEEGVGPPTCNETCTSQEVIADWAAWEKAITPDDWKRLLYGLDLATLDDLLRFLKGEQKAPPPAFAGSPITSLPGGARGRVVSALYLVGFAIRVNALAQLPSSAWDEPPGQAARPRPPSPDLEALQRGGERSLARATDPFLRQRYAFLLTRLRFYRKDWAGVAAFHARQEAALAGPSTALRWRARSYLAGAHWRARRFAEANLELARIHVAFPPLARQVRRDFHPMEEADWRRTLALARTVSERVELWNLVGLTSDPLVALREIATLNPRSRRIPPLAVAELNQLERAGQEPNSQEAQALERAVIRIAETPGTDRPWVLDLVAAHLAAGHGDVAATRRLAARARARGAPEGRARTQADVSIALALAQEWRPGNAAADEELAKLAPWWSLDGPLEEARLRVRDTLRDRCRVANLDVEAELLRWPRSGKPRSTAIRSNLWDEPARVQALLERVSGVRTGWDRFLVEGSSLRATGVREDLARLHLVRGELQEASRVLDGEGRDGDKLGTDPFVLHIVDCHDCDHRQYQGASWTLRALTRRLAELERIVGEGGPGAADAAYALGSALYNVTWSGNARSAFEGGHIERPDTRAAERWIAAAHGAARDPELKAMAAAMGAKCELARAPGDEVSATWYPRLRDLAGTAYEREVLAECGWYRRWVQGAKAASKVPGG